MCNTSFRGILTGKSIYSIILVIEGHLQGYLQGQKVNSKVNGIKNMIFNKHKYQEVYLFSVCFLTRKSIYSIILVIEGHLQGHLQVQKVNSKVKGIKKYDFQ